MKKISIAVFVLVILNGCASSGAGFATSNIPIEGKKFEILGEAETTLSWWTFDIGILGVPLSTPPVDRVQEILLEKYRGNALVNMRYWNDRTIIFMFTRNRLHLKADVVNVK